MGRGPQLSEADAVRAMRELGITPADFQLIEQASSYPEKCERLEELRAKAKAGFKKAALRLHPDIPANRSEEKTEMFKLVARVLDDIGRLRVRPPRPVMRPIFVQAFSFSGTATNSTTATSSWGFGPTITIRVG